MIAQPLIAELPKGKVIWTSEKENLTLNLLTGEEASEYFNEIAGLRIGLFKEFPYLYEGSLEYEAGYLQTYFKAKSVQVLLLFDGDKVVGFSNSISLAEESDEFKKPFLDQGLKLEDYLYIGEVMFNADYRQKGIARQIMDHHATRAKELGTKQCFITVDRPDDHPARPTDYQPTDPLWIHFGFNKADFTMKMKWQQVDTHKEEENTLNIWVKE